jgi:hypothetical protein
MYPYPPIIEFEAYEDPDSRLASEGASSSDQSQKGAKGCVKRGEDETEESTQGKVVSLVLNAGGTSTSYKESDHADIASDEATRPCFAPKHESGTITWTLENGDKGSGATIEVYHRGDGHPIFTHILEKTETDSNSGEVVWDGKVDEDADEESFPAGYINVQMSPYKIKITLHNDPDQPGGVDSSESVAWTYFDVLIETIDLEWGSYDLLDTEREDIDEAYKEKLLGPPSSTDDADGAGDTEEAGDVGDTEDESVGLEEQLLIDLSTANAKPIEDVKHEVTLESNLFAKREEGENNTSEFADQTDYDEYGNLWGKGPRIPIVATVKVKTSGGTGTTLAPEALAGATLLWDWQDNEPDRWKTPLTPAETPEHTEAFLNSAYHKDPDAKPDTSCNAPKHFGGKFGDDGTPVFPEVGEEDAFPFQVRLCETRKWASLSHFPELPAEGDETDAGADAEAGSGTDGEAAEDEGQESYKTGVIFQPSRMAGDKYNVSVQLYFDPAFDSEDDIETNPPAVSKAGEFEVFRKVNLKYLSYGAPDFGCTPDTCLSDTADLFLKEANIKLDFEKVAIVKADYEAALEEALDAMLATPKLYRDISFQSPLSYKYLISKDLPANSPPIVYKEKTYLDELETAFKDGRVQRFASIENRSDFLIEKVTGAAQGHEGYVLNAMSTKANDPIEILFEDPTMGYVHDEEITGFPSEAVGKVVLEPQWDFWGVEYEEVESEDNDYKHKIDVDVGGTVVTIDYERTGFRRRFSQELPEAAITALRAEFPNHDRNASLKIKLTSKNGPSARGVNRLNNVKIFLKEALIDRMAIFEKQRDGYENIIHDARGITGFVAYKQFPQTILPMIAQAYIKNKHEEDDAIFLLHVPGRTNIKDMDWATEATRPYKETQLAGALFAAESTRNQGIIYISSLPDADNVKSTPSKKHEAIFAHEIAHALFLPHAMHRTGNDPGEVVENKHVKGDTCIMNYDLDSERFCGLCMLRLRGWKTDPGEFHIGTPEYKIELRLGDINSLFEEGMGTMKGTMARLQTLGMFSHPLDHLEANACLNYSWSHAEKLFPSLVDATTEDARDTITAEITKYLIGGDALPAADEFARMRTPAFTLLYALNYLEGKFSEDEQGSAEAKHFENFKLGEDPREVETLFFEQNKALGKIPLEVEVKVRPAGSDVDWDDAEHAQQVHVHFEFIATNPDDAPDGPDTLTVGGGTTYYTSAKGAKQFGLEAKNITHTVQSDGNGIASMNFEPGMVGGHAYKIRAYVGPRSQAKPNVLGDDMVETGTLVRWRSLRVCNHVRMAAPATVAEFPDCLNHNGAPYSANYADYVGALPDLDITDHITKEFAKSYVEILLESDAEAPTDLKDYEEDLRAEIDTLFTDYPDFSRTSRIEGRHKNNMSIFRELMNPSGTEGKKFEITLSGRPEISTLTVRPEGGKLGSAVLNDESGETDALDILENYSVDYDARTVEIEFKENQGETQFQVCYKIEKFIDADKLLAPIPDQSPFLFNLALPQAYNDAIGAGTYPMALDEGGRLVAHSGANPHYFAIDGTKLGLVKGLLMSALWRALDKNKGFAPGISIVEAASMENYTTVPDNAGVQEGKAVGQCIFLFGGNGAEAAKYNALAIHEISHALYLQHAPGTPTASGVAPGEHDKLRKLKHDAPDSEDTPDFDTEIPCVMSYDDRKDGHHCTKCVENLRGVE